MHNGLKETTLKNFALRIAEQWIITKIEVKIANNC